MSEVNVYGANVFSSSAYDTGIDNRQYALFRLKPEFIYTDGTGIRIGYWLKNVASAEAFSNVAGHGYSHQNWASTSTQGIRPRFLIG